MNPVKTVRFELKYRCEGAQEWITVSCHFDLDSPRLAQQYKEYSAKPGDTKLFKVATVRTEVEL